MQTTEILDKKLGILNELEFARYEVPTTQHGRKILYLHITVSETKTNVDIEPLYQKHERR